MSINPPQLFERQLEYAPDQTVSAYIHIDSLALGPALGGCRIDVVSPRDAQRRVRELAAGMTRKAALANLALGGGKMFVIAGPAQRTDRLFGSIGDFVESLGGDYVTAEDVGTTTAHMDVVKGRTDHVAGLRDVSGDPSPMTAFGVYQALRGAMGIENASDLGQTSVAIRGLGKVGYATIFGFPDTSDYTAARERFSGLIHLCEKLYVSDLSEKAVGRVQEEAERLGLTGKIQVCRGDSIFAAPADVFMPMAAGYSVSEGINLLGTSGHIRYIVSGENTPFDPNARDDQVQSLLERGVTVAVDFVANAGGLINAGNGYLWRISDVPYNQAAALDAIEGIAATTMVIKEQDGNPYHVAERMAQERINVA